ncbi:uncharacterized protein LOC129591036 isoform X2 [Paramacrobiotus metropolitanus]|uniref:uncharacterized protein LOC129591036 isoform X2 n=1 Tax=Paramacrobiotus metropolitanus TaxID=2943436 RepID=UPI002445CBEC|nr:uncharacterized protein LOC129591036 isoform X2 [Paramacrobiotus metropolitanus]
MCSLLPICMETSIGFLRNFVFDCNKFAPLEGENGTSCGRLAVHITAMIQYFSLGFFLGLTAAISLRVFILKSVTARAHSAFGDVKIPAIYRTEKGFADNYFKMIHVSASLFLGLTWLAIHGMVRCNGDDAPNPGCEYLISPGNTTLSCPGGMDIPVNFDVTKIRKGVHEIVIAAGNGNVLRSDAPPLPANLTALRKISFSGFTNEHDSRIAIKRFLDNVKDHITELRIDNSKVGFLEDGFLHGFTQLTTLDLSGCDISSIGLEAFARTAIDVATPSMIVDLAGNRIESIDWAVLEPIALTSLSLQLGSQTPGLKLINCSANYIFNRPVGSVSFAGTSLE